MKLDDSPNQEHKRRLKRAALPDGPLGSDPGPYAWMFKDEGGSDFALDLHTNRLFA